MAMKNAQDDKRSEADDEPGSWARTAAKRRSGRRRPTTGRSSGSRRSLWLRSLRGPGLWITVPVKDSFTEAQMKAVENRDAATRKTMRWHAIGLWSWEVGDPAADGDAPMATAAMMRTWRSP